MEHDLYLWSFNYDAYSVFLVIVTNLPQRIKTDFVLQGPKYF